MNNDDRQIAASMLGEAWELECLRTAQCPDADLLDALGEESFRKTPTTPALAALTAHVASCDYCGREVGRQHEIIRLRESGHIESLANQVRRRSGIERYMSLAHVPVMLILGALLGGGGWLAIDYLNNRTLRVFVKPLATARTPTIIIGNCPVHVDGESSNSFVGVGDAKSLAIMQELLARHAPRDADINVVTSSELNDRFDQLGGSVVIIGGPGANRLALLAMCESRKIDPSDKDALAKTGGFRFVGKEHARQSALLRASSGAIGIEDVRTAEIAPYDPDSGRNVALAVRTTFRGRETLILAGFDTESTLALARALSTQTEVLKELHQAYQASGYAELVVATSPRGATVYKFPTAMNPRVK